MPTLEVIRAQLAATRAQLQATGHHRPQRPLPVQILEIERPEAPAHGRLRMVSPGELLLDPPRIQLLLSAGTDGTSGRLEGCPSFRLELCGAVLGWIDPADGSGPWLVDGHHRRALALADDAPLVPVLLVEAATAEEARALLALEADLFGRCCTGELELEQALALAVAPDHTLQRRLWVMATQRSWSPPQTLEAAHLAHLAPQGQAQAPAGTLPGLEALMSEANTLLDEQLTMRATIRRLLRCENRAVRVVGHHRSAEALERRGVAAIDQKAAQEVKAETGLLLDRFALLAGHSSPLAVLISQLAQEVAAGSDVARVIKAQMQEIRDVLSAELG
jgi:hypothetical protein